MRITIMFILPFCILLFTGCEMIRSKKRSPEPVSFELPGNIMLTATGAVNIYVPFFANHVDFLPSSFRIDANGTIIYIDPVLLDDALPADYILITHKHGDHFSLPDVKKLLKKETVLVGPKNVAKVLFKKLSGYTIKNVKPGDRLKFDKITIETMAAYNLKTGFLGLTPHPRSSLNVGYIITSDSTRIYHAGDTDYVPEMNDLENITAALVPIDGGGLTMSTEKAAEFINNLKPKFAIPMHYGIGTDQIEKFRELVDDEIQVLVMDDIEM